MAGSIRSHETRLDGHGSDIDSLKEDVKHIRREVDGLAGNIDVIVPLVVQMAGKPIEASQSPRVLTPYGKELAEAIDASSIVDENLDELKKAVRFSEQANSYDLQEACFALNDFYKMLQGKQAERYKTTAFEKGIDIAQLDKIVAYVLRDKLIAEHPDWELGR